MIHFCTSPTDCNEVSNIISSLNHKTVRPNSIPAKVLKLSNKDIYNQLASLFNQCLSSGIFSKILKTRKVIPVHEKDYEIKKLSILIKPLKESCITDFIHSLKKSNSLLFLNWSQTKVFNCSYINPFNRTN